VGYEVSGGLTALGWLPWLIFGAAGADQGQIHCRLHLEFEMRLSLGMRMSLAAVSGWQAAASKR
jgi:hypothetical protein